MAWFSPDVRFSESARLRLRYSVFAGCAGFQRPIAGRAEGADGERHKSRPLIEVYRSRQCKRQRNRRGGETKVTRVGARVDGPVGAAGPVGGTGLSWPQ